jgi:hypothetical protein
MTKRGEKGGNKSKEAKRQSRGTSMMSVVTSTSLYMYIFEIQFSSLLKVNASGGCTA